MTTRVRRSLFGMAGVIFAALKLNGSKRSIHRGRLAYISLHDPRVTERYPELSYEQLMAQIWVITPDHQSFGGADAIRFLSRYLPRLWWIAPVMHMPFAMPLWRYLYRVIANQRYRLAGESCESGTCSLHAQDQYQLPPSLTRSRRPRFQRAS